MANKYKPGELVGPFNILLKRDSYKTNYGHRYCIFECPICHNEFEAKLYHITSGSTQKCKQCRGKQRSGINNSNFKDLTGMTFGKLTVIKYLGSKIIGNKGIKRNFWECKCECGNIIERTTNELTTHNITRCPNCRISSLGEEKIKDILQSLKIEYECQKTFLTCKDKHCLPFDFYLPNLNICIEYDGLGHYLANSKSEWRTEKAVKLTQEHDNIKNQWCKENNIKLIRIPYYDYNKLNEEFLQKLIIN